MPHIRTIEPSELAMMQREGRAFELIDVRTPAEYAAAHVAGAKLAPLDELDPHELMHGRDAGEPIYVICQSGTRGSRACEKLLQAGHVNVINVAGGTAACLEAGLDIVRGRGVISLERQVRIAAGSLVVIGIVLALTVNIWLLGISAFVGCGLIFAGVTDYCGMGMLLAKMPWNRRAGAKHTETKKAASAEQVKHAG